MTPTPFILLTQINPRRFREVFYKIKGVGV